VRCRLTQFTVRHSLSQTLSCKNEEDIGRQLALEREDNSSGNQSLSALDASVSKTVVYFSQNDLDNPYNWSSVCFLGAVSQDNSKLGQIKKVAIVALGILTVLDSIVGSTLPSGDSAALAVHFDVTVQEQLVLPNSMYLVGYVLGPLLFAPLSESYGRQIIILSTFAGLILSSLALCLSPNWSAFIIIRLIQGVFASSPISVTGG